MKRVVLINKIIITICAFFVSLNIIYAKEVVEFSDCVDGDTFKVTIDNEKHTVRMLAVDTPESVHPTKGVEYYGKEASNYTCETLKNAKKIELEYDDNSDKTDKYDRLLAWVFVDDELHQANLIKNGYAKIAYLYDDYKYTNELQDLQEKASAQGIGVWDTEAKEEYNNQNGIENTDEDNETSTETINSEKINNNESGEEYSTIDIIIIVILVLVIIFASKKTTKNKAKKKLKKYLN